MTSLLHIIFDLLTNYFEEDPEWSHIDMLVERTSMESLQNHM